MASGVVTRVSIRIGAPLSGAEVGVSSADVSSVETVTVRTAPPLSPPQAARPIAAVARAITSLGLVMPHAVALATVAQTWRFGFGRRQASVHSRAGKPDVTLA